MSENCRIFAIDYESWVSPLVYFLALFGVVIPEPFVMISQAMDGIKTIINVITHLENFLSMKKNTNTMEPRKMRKTILLSVQTVLEVGGLE